MRQRWIALGLIALCSLATPQGAEAGRFYRYMENKGHNIHPIGPKIPFVTFNTEYYNLRYPFNRYYTQQGHSFNGYPQYNR
ncbi:MAG: hypothetical protein R3C12_02220 [Planctomycetaceae bacterium]|nr:hypothetical protein [Planctomycetaceae bacterium]